MTRDAIRALVLAGNAGYGRRLKMSTDTPDGDAPRPAWILVDAASTLKERLFIDVQASEPKWRQPDSTIPGNGQSLEAVYAKRNSYATRFQVGFYDRVRPIAAARGLSRPDIQMAASLMDLPFPILALNIITEQEYCSRDMLSLLLSCDEP